MALARNARRDRVSAIARWSWPAPHRKDRARPLPETAACRNSTWARKLLAPSVHGKALRPISPMPLSIASAMASGSAVASGRSSRMSAPSLRRRTAAMLCERVSQLTFSTCSIWPAKCFRSPATSGARREKSSGRRLRHRLSPPPGSPVLPAHHAREEWPRRRPTSGSAASPPRLLRNAVRARPAQPIRPR